MELTGEFSSSLIYQDADTSHNGDASYFNKLIGNHDVIELKGNLIPKGLVPMDLLFSNHDTLLKPTTQSSEENVLNCNINIVADPKFVKLSKPISFD